MQVNSLSQVHVSTGSGKMSSIPSVNTSSLQNNFCIKMAKGNSVCGVCYSNRLTKYRQNLEKKLLENHELLSSSILDESELPTFNNRYVRFSSFGELINKTHYINLCNIAKKNPHTTFGLWTKRYRLIKDLPKVPNIKYIYSVSMINGKEPSDKVKSFFDKCFIAVTKNNKANCFGKCIDCLLCYTDNSTTVIREHVK